MTPLDRIKLRANSRECRGSFVYTFLVIRMIQRSIIEKIIGKTFENIKKRCQHLSKIEPESMKQIIVTNGKTSTENDDGKYENDVFLLSEIVQT